MHCLAKTAQLFVRLKVPSASRDRPCDSGPMKRFSIKVDTHKKEKIRYEVGDPVFVGKKSAEPSIGRIVSFQDPRSGSGKKRIRTLKIDVLKRDGYFGLVESGSGAARVDIEETQLMGHAVLLPDADFESIRTDAS